MDLYYDPNVDVIFYLSQDSVTEEGRKYHHLLHPKNQSLIVDVVLQVSYFILSIFFLYYCSMVSILRKKSFLKGGCDTPIEAKFLRLRFNS